MHQSTWKVQETQKHDGIYIKEETREGGRNRNEGNEEGWTRKEERGTGTKGKKEVKSEIERDIEGGRHRNEGNTEEGRKRNTRNEGRGDRGKEKGEVLKRRRRRKRKQEWEIRAKGTKEGETDATAGCVKGTSWCGVAVVAVAAVYAPPVSELGGSGMRGGDCFHLL